MTRNARADEPSSPPYSTARLFAVSELVAGIVLDNGGNRRLGIRVTFAEPDEELLELELDVTGLDLPGFVASVEHVVAEYLRLEAVELGIEEQEAQRVGRESARRLRREARARARSTAFDDAAALHCSRCSRPTAIIDTDGTRYCKRHADAAGIRPRGKIA